MPNSCLPLSHKYESVVALCMCFILAVIIDGFYVGEARTGGGSAGITIYGTQARISLVFFAIMIIYPYLHKLHKNYRQTYKVFICGAIVAALMYLGCSVFPWWNPLMAIPLTIIWYPFHYRIRKGLPRKNTDTGGDDSHGQPDSQ